MSTYTITPPDFIPIKGTEEFNGNIEFKLEKEKYEELINLALENYLKEPVNI